MTNQCDGCTVCCTILNIPEFDAPAGTPCQHECSVGCAIYASRPQPCADFKCVYLDSGLDVSYRPDNLQLMITIFATQYGKCIVAHELVPGIFWHRKQASFVASVAKQEDAFVLIFSGSERFLLFPEWKNELRQDYESDPNFLDKLNITA